VEVALRVDASATIGLGHLKRCLSLAHALRSRGASCRFVARDLGLDAAALASASGFEVHRLAAPSPVNGEAAADLGSSIAHAHWAGVSQAQDAADTLAALRSALPEWLVVDHYSLDATWHRALSGALGCRLAAIDDLADRDLAVDLLVDHNLAGNHRAKYGERLPAVARLLGGPRYALLGPAYAGAARCVVDEQVASIGIFMGGVDAAGFSAAALDACSLAGFDGPVEIATTSANPHLARLAAAAAARPNTRLCTDLADLCAFFARHGLQIGAGGGATWERCCLGAPTLAVVVADNQRPVLQPLAGLGVLATSDAAPGCQRNLAADLRRLLDDAPQRRRLSARAQQLVDGHGAARVAEALLECP
jgi:UDP-2,4-diacetamido-2,4,6-trideoxy-beta-L-altropyranose hydrolase